MTLAVIELENATPSHREFFAPFELVYDGLWSPLWFIDSSIPLWNNIKVVKYPQDSRSETKQNY